MPDTKKAKARKVTPQNAQTDPKDPSKKSKASKEDTIKVANSDVEPGASGKRSRKSASAVKEAADKIEAAPMEKPGKKRKTNSVQDIKPTDAIATGTAEAEGDAVRVEQATTTAAKGKATKSIKRKDAAPKADIDPAIAGKAVNVRPTKTQKSEKDAAETSTTPVAAQPKAPKGKKATGKVAVEKADKSSLPSIEQASLNLLEAAKDGAAGAFKKADAIVVEPPRAKSEAKGKKRKATEEMPTTEATRTEEAASATSKKKQKKEKSTAEKVVTSIGDRVSSFLDSIGEAIGAKSIADDITAVAEDVAEDKVKEEGKGKGKKSTVGKAKAKAGTSAAKAKGGDIAATAAADDEDEWEPDDQTADLIKGFVSDEEDKESGDEGFKESKTLPKLPSKKGLSKKLKDAAGLQKADEPGVIYVGRVPHGFHEHQMRAYFSQFGELNHVRLSRSKKTGRSKHYAFLEFASAEVAKIAAETMNNYLLFGHILKCSVVPKEQVHPNLWVGADKRFKAVPWAKIEGRKLELPQGRSQWDKRVQNERKRREQKAAKLKEVMGYEMEVPKVDGTETVPKREGKKTKAKGDEKAKEVEAPKREVEEKTIVVVGDPQEGSVVVSEEVKTKKTKKAKSKEEKKPVEETVAAAIETTKPAREAKAKKTKAKESKTEETKTKSTPAKETKEAKEAKAKAADASETKADDTAAKRTPKPSKRALEAQEFEASSARKPKKAKK